MFLWVNLPDGCTSMDLFHKAINKKVAFVPGTPFFVDGAGENTLRLNYSNSDAAKIEEGIKRLGQCIKDFLAKPCAAGGSA
jgi:2-aminoadipate transaminase